MDSVQAEVCAGFILINVMTPIQPQQQVAQLPRLAFRVIDEKGILIQPRQQMAHVLSPVAAFIWARMKQPVTLAQLADAVAGEFSVTPETALADCGEFVDDLLARGMAEVRA